MPAYRFVGAVKSGFHGTKYQFTRFGQSVEMPEALAESAIEHENALLLPEAEWAKLGISDKDLTPHKAAMAAVGQAATGAKIPQPMESMLKSAWLALHDYREAKRAATLVAQAPPPEEAPTHEEGQE